MGTLEILGNVYDASGGGPLCAVFVKIFIENVLISSHRWLLADYIKVSNLSVDQMLYTEKDLDASMEKIEVMHFHQEKEVSGIKFWAYNAGHVLGKIQS